MDTTTNVIRQDIKVARNAIDDKDFGMVNVIGNRIMSNLLVEGREELMIIGWMLKDLGGELSGIKERKEEGKLEDAIKSAKEHLDELGDMLVHKRTSASDLWDRYFDIEKKIRKDILSKSEADEYKEEHEFSKKAAIMLIEHLHSNRELLLKKNNRLISGVANDLSRIVNGHGGKEAIVVYLVFRALDHYYGYLMYEEGIDGKIEDESRFKSKIDEYIDKVYEMASMIRDAQIDDLYEHSNRILGKLGSAYRKYFINYLDIPRIVVEREIEIPEKAKEKIGDIVSKSFEKELE
ncbi:MAG: hypothetical protein WBE22_11325 [Halobacteriota archaeon]|jgi:hypothetical protein